MRKQLLYDPILLLERLGKWATDRRRLRSLRRTPAQSLSLGHIESLELLQLLAPLRPQIIFDIGAHVGTWTILARSVYPQAQIHAFEPLSSHCKAFAEATSNIANVRLHPFALGDSLATVQLRVLDRSDASSILPLTEACATHYHLSETERTAVPQKTLDEMLDQGTPAPDVIKMDVQGYELAVLAGAKRTLTMASAILVEVSLVELYKGQPLFSDVAGFLSAHGFHLYGLGHGTPLGEPIWQADALFLSIRAEALIRS